MKLNRARNIATELNEVHRQMLGLYNSENKNIADIKRAKDMEEVLRKIKKMNLDLGKDSKNIISAFDEQYFNIFKTALIFLQNKGLKAEQLFHTTHGEGVLLQKDFNVDDIFEAELTAVLRAMEATTLGAVEDNLNLGPFDITSNKFTSKVIGREQLNVNNNLLQVFANKIPEEVCNEILTGIKTKVENFSPDSSKPYKKIKAFLGKKPQARSGKTDVQSFDLNFKTELREDLPEKIRSFSNARFSVKNYKLSGAANSKYKEQVSLGNTNAFKAITAQLTHLGYDYADSIHLFIKSRESWKKYKTESVKEHIPHLRFAYELEGNGLFSKENGENSILGADFFIVNDSTSDEIYVNSTKELIRRALIEKDGFSNIDDPFTSHMFVLSVGLRDSEKSLLKN